MKSFFPAVASIILILFGGCSLDTPADSPQAPALQLHVTQDQSLIHLQWSAVNVTGFEEYILLQSPSDIPNNPEPEVNQDVVVVERFDDVSVTSFSTVNTLFTPQTCYKLYTRVNDRFLYSPTVCVDNPVSIIPGFYDRVAYNEAGNDLVMFDRINSVFSVYDLDSEGMINSISENQLSFPLLDVVQQSGQPVVYAFDQNQGWVKKYNLPQLTLAAQKQLLNGLAGAEADGTFLYIGTQNIPSSFQVWDPSLNVKDNRDGFIGFRQFASFPGDTTIVLEIWETGTRRYKINSMGKVLSYDDFLTGISQLSSQNTCDVNDQHYIGGRFSTIMDRNANIITSLNEDLNTFAFFSRFSEDNSKAIVLLQDQVDFMLEIHDISGLPATHLVQRYAMPAATYADVFINNNVIHLVGISFNSSNTQTFILKIPLE